MLTKKQFIERIEFIEDFHNRMCEFDEALRNYAPSDFSGFFDDKTYQYLIARLGEDVNDDNDYIGWWICETEFGKNKNMCKIWEGDTDHDPDWIVDTPEQLYDYIFIQNTKAPSKESVQLAVKAQDNGVKFALKIIEEMQRTNEKTKNEGWGERGVLLQYAQDKIEREYRLQRGIGADLNFSKNLHIISVLDEES